jgi:hypothetical protein
VQFANATLTSNGLPGKADSSGQLFNFPGHPPVNYVLHSLYTPLHVNRCTIISIAQQLLVYRATCLFNFDKLEKRAVNTRTINTITKHHEAVWNLFHAKMNKKVNVLNCKIISKICKNGTSLRKTMKLGTRSNTTTSYMLKGCYSNPCRSVWNNSHRCTHNRSRSHQVTYDIEQVNGKHFLNKDSKVKTSSHLQRSKNLWNHRQSQTNIRISHDFTKAVENVFIYNS